MKFLTSASNNLIDSMAYSKNCYHCFHVLRPVCRAGRRSAHMSVGDWWPGRRRSSHPAGHCNSFGWRDGYQRWFRRYYPIANRLCHHHSFVKRHEYRCRQPLRAPGDTGCCHRCGGRIYLGSHQDIGCEVSSELQIRQYSNTLVATSLLNIVSAPASLPGVDFSIVIQIIS